MLNEVGSKSTHRRTTEEKLNNHLIWSLCGVEWNQIELNGDQTPKKKTVDDFHSQQIFTARIDTPILSQSQHNMVKHRDKTS